MGGEFGDPANGELARTAGREGPGVGAARREKSEFGLFRRQAVDLIENRQGKSLEILGKSLEKAWKSLEKAWKKLGIPWKNLGAKRRRRASFLDPKDAL